MPESRPRRSSSALSTLSHRVSNKVVRHPTSYIETLIHLLKGNIGAGVFAMGYAFQHAGLVVATVLTILIGALCLYCDHLLISASLALRNKLGLELNPNFSETVELCFELGPNAFKKWTGFARFTVKFFIIVTQLGFCSVYIVLVSTTLAEVLSRYGIDISVSLYMIIIYVPILLSCLIRTLKFLAPISLISNIMLAFAIISTLYLSCFDLPDIKERSMAANILEYPIYFGTTIFAFEGIGLILPLLTEMKHQRLFYSPSGVLNIGMVVVTLLFTLVGFIGYLKYGDSIHGTIALNLPQDEVFSSVIQLVLAVGVLFTYPIQFYIANQVIWTEIEFTFSPIKHPLLYESLLRFALVTLTLGLGLLVPKLGLFISLIGAVSSTMLAMVYPPLCDVARRCCPPEDTPLVTRFQCLRLTMDAIVLIVGFLGFATGTYCSIVAIVEDFTTHGFKAQG